MSAVFVKDKKGPDGIISTGFVASDRSLDLEHAESCNLEGFGQQTLPDGTKIQGEFVKNKLHGVGFVKHPDG